MKIEVEISLSKETLEMLGNLVKALSGKKVANAPKIEEKPKSEELVAQTEKALEIENTGTSESTEGITAEETTSEKETNRTVIDVREAFTAAKRRVGNSDGCKAILNKFGVSKVADLKPSQYEEAIRLANELGA